MILKLEAQDVAAITVIEDEVGDNQLTLSRNVTSEGK